MTDAQRETIKAHAKALRWAALALEKACEFSSPEIVSQCMDDTHDAFDRLVEGTPE